MVIHPLRKEKYRYNVVLDDDDDDKDAFRLMEVLQANARTAVWCRGDQVQSDRLIIARPSI